MHNDGESERGDREVVPAQANGEHASAIPAAPASAMAQTNAIQNGTPSRVIRSVEA